MKNKEIDYSEIPKLTPERIARLEQVTPRKYYKQIPIKESCYMKIDKAILDFFGKGREKGYQTKINEALKTYIEEHPEARVQTETQR